MLSKRDREIRDLIPSFRIRRYETAEDLTQAAYGGETSMYNGPFLWPRDRLLQRLKKMGFWGLVRHQPGPPTLHWWHDGKRPYRTLLTFFAHELGHIVDEDADREVRADQYAAVAIKAHNLARYHARKSGRVGR